MFYKLFHLRMKFSYAMRIQWNSACFGFGDRIRTILSILGGVKRSLQLNTVHYRTTSILWQQSTIEHAVFNYSSTTYSMQFNLIHAPMKISVNTIKHKTCTRTVHTHTILQMPLHVSDKWQSFLSSSSSSSDRFDSFVHYYIYYIKLDQYCDFVVALAAAGRRSTSIF